MKIDDVQERWDLGKVIVRLRCSHTTILDIDVQQRLGQPISEIREGGGLVCPMCSLPARHIRGEMGKLLLTSGATRWVRPAEYCAFTREEVWALIGPAGPGVPSAPEIPVAPRPLPTQFALHLEDPPPASIACIPYGPLDAEGGFDLAPDLVLLAPLQDAPGLSPNYLAIALLGRPVAGNALLIGMQGNPWRE